MAIWSAEIKDLEKLYESFKGQFPNLDRELEQLIKFDDPNVILLYSRRCLEVIITDLCECELKRPRKTEPLKGIIDKLHKEEKVPSHIITSMDHLNGLSTYGAHPKDFDPQQVKPVLNNLDIIIKWYLKYKNNVTNGKTEDEGEKSVLRAELLKEVKNEGRKEVQEKPDRLHSKKVLINSIVIVVLLSIAATFLFLKIFKKDTLEKLKSSGEKLSIAVMPFRNMTNDTLWNVWQDGIQDNLITSLSNSEELKVRQTESITGLLQSKGLTNYASITPSIASTISQKLDANIFIYGSINQAGSTVRINAQLINSKTNDAIKSFQVDGIAGNILHIIDSLSWMVKNSLIVSKMEKELSLDFKSFPPTNSPEAYRYFIYGQKAFLKRDNVSAIRMYSQALTIDSNFTSAAIMLPFAYRNQGLYEEAKKWCLKIYAKRDQMTMQQKNYTNYAYAIYFETFHEAIKYIKQLLELDDQVPLLYYLLVGNYNRLYQYDKAIPEGEKALEIYKKWDSKPESVWAYTTLGFAYHKTNQYKKEKTLYKKAELEFPNNHELIYMQAILSLSEGDTIAAEQYIKKYISIRKDNSLSEAGIATSLATIYSEAGILDKAEEYYRQAISLEPGKPGRMNALAYFLIDKDRNTDEGLELINKALELSPDNYNMLDTKGWGLFKKGKFELALEILEKSWNLKPFYNHELYLHLEEAKKAFNSKKNN